MAKLKRSGFSRKRAELRSQRQVKNMAIERRKKLLSLKVSVRFIVNYGLCKDNENTVYYDYSKFDVCLRNRIVCRIKVSIQFLILGGLIFDKKN